MQRLLRVVRSVRAAAAAGVRVNVSVGIGVDVGVDACAALRAVVCRVPAPQAVKMIDRQTVRVSCQLELQVPCGLAQAQQEVQPALSPFLSPAFSLCIKSVAARGALQRIDQSPFN